MQYVWILVFLSITLVLLPFQNVVASEFDEYGVYSSLGNTWIEITHSVANNPPWQLDWRINHSGEVYPKQYSLEEIELIKKFYLEYEITIIDVVHSSKHSQLCEAEGCIWGTYHLLISNKDNEKFQQLDFGFVTFADSGIIESTVGGDGVQVAHWEAEKIFLSSDGKFELNLNLSYDSPDPTTVSYYSRESSSEVFVDVAELNFIDSVLVLVYPYGAASFDHIPISVDSISSKKANVEYSANLDFPHNPLYGDRVEFGLGWIRIFEDENDQRYYQWMRSRSANLLSMNEVQKANGTFFVYSPFPEFAHKSNDSSLRGFDYVDWIKHNVLTEEFSSVEQQWKNHWIGGNYYNSNSQLTFQVFKISYKISEGDVENVEYLNNINNLVFKTKIDTNGILQVKYPRNLPYTNYGFEDNILIIVNGKETKFDEEKTECYIEFSIPLQDDSSDIELLGTFNLGSSPIRSIEVPNKCILKSSPLHQILNGNLPENIICKPDLELIFKSTDGSPACVKPTSIEKLIERGWA